jgi:hypothetical protein
MQKTLYILFFLCTLSIQAQEINLTIGDQLYNNVVDVIPLETGGWLVVADVSEVEQIHQMRPRLLRVSADNTIEWSVKLPSAYYAHSTIALRYDSLIQQCYVLHERFECDLNLSDVIYSFDMDGNLLWTDSDDTGSLSNLSNSATTIAMVPEEGFFVLGSGNFSFPALLFKNTLGTLIQEYAYEGSIFSGVYYWRPDSLLLTRGNRLLYAAYDADSLHIFSEQILTNDNIKTIHVLNDSVIYSQSSNTITRYNYMDDNGIFLADTTVEMPTASYPYHLSFDNNAIFAAAEQRLFAYTHDLRERTEQELNIPGTQLFGAASNNQDLVVYGNTKIAGVPGFYPCEGILLSLTGEPLLKRDLELVRVSSTGIIQTETPQGEPVSTFDSIRVTVYNAGMDTISSLHVKVQKGVINFLCPSNNTGLNESFQGLQLLPGDSISLYLGSLTGYYGLNNTLCAWVGTEASSLEVDFSNNRSCTEVDIINALETPSSLPTFSVYPNPTSNLLYFNNTDQWQYYHLFDARGVLLQQAPLPKEETTIQLDVADLPAGLYHLVLDGREGRAQVWVVKE